MMKLSCQTKKKKKLLRNLKTWWPTNSREESQCSEEKTTIREESHYYIERNVVDLEREERSDAKKWPGVRHALHERGRTHVREQLDENNQQFFFC